MKDPIILSIDTSTDQMTAVISRGNKILVNESHTERHQVQKLLRLIDTCLEKCSISLNDIDAFATTKGPGSFTGVRTAMGTIKSLAYSTSKPLIAISTLEAMVHPCDRKTPVVATLPARTDYIYMGVFEFTSDQWHKVTPACMIPAKELRSQIPANSLIVGSMANSKFEGIYGTSLSEISLKKYTNKEFEDVFTLEPLYIQKTAAEGYV